MDSMEMKGKYTVTYTDERTGKSWREVFYNTLTVGFYNAVFGFLNQSVTLPDDDALNVTHIAIGTGETAPTQADTDLVTETFRKAVSYRGFNTTRFSGELSIAAAEGNPTGDYIKEVGVFCKATDTADSGLLISRALVNIYKTSNISIIITWELSY